MQIYMKPSRQERADLLKRIVAAQSRAGLSYADIASGAGVDPSQVSRICRGQFTTLGGAVMKICMFLDVQPNPAFGPTAPSSSGGRADPGWAQLNRAV